MEKIAFVSIVMTYYERLTQLKNTLKSFDLLKYTDFEVIIVDDKSKREPLYEDLFKAYSFPIRLIAMPENNHTNPCIPFNAGFSIAKGDIVIIQNAECLHVGNVLEHARRNLRENNYLTYACYGFNEKMSYQLNSNNIYDLRELSNIIYSTSIDSNEEHGYWCNHSVYRPKALHFTSAITANNLKILGGFDIRYADGTAYDDEEILFRVRMLGLTVNIIDNVCVIHQWHGRDLQESKYKALKLQARNMLLFYMVTKRERALFPQNDSIKYTIYRVFRQVFVLSYLSYYLVMRVTKSSVSIMKNRIPFLR